LPRPSEIGRTVLRSRATLGVVPLALATLLLSGCYQGAYPVDYFREMHYQQSQRLMEAERLSPPDGSVPRTGGRPVITFTEASTLQNPLRASGSLSASATQARQNFRTSTDLMSQTKVVDKLRSELQGAGVTGSTLQQIIDAEVAFKTNCAICHGGQGNGQSFVQQRFTNAKIVAPADLTSDRVRSRSDGELYWIVNNGIGNMPPFRELLTEDQIWSLVLEIRDLQGQR
jgi:hypothetical protein